MCTFGQVGVVVVNRSHPCQSAYLVFTSLLHPDHQCCHHPPVTEICEKREYTEDNPVILKYI